MSTQEPITVEVPLDIEGTVYIFTGPEADVDQRIDEWLTEETPTYDTTRPMTAADWEAVESYVIPPASTGTAIPTGNPDPRRSEAYQDALLKQLDYDSTRTGRNALQAQIAEATDPDTIKALYARDIAAEAAYRFRREALATMPPAPPKDAPAYKDAHRPLARAKELLAQHLALATAETRAFTRPSPETVTTLTSLAAEAQKHAQRFGFAWFGPLNELGAAAFLTAPTRAVDPSDVPMLWALGAQATWDGQHVQAGGDLTGVWAYGYRATRPAGGTVTVMEAPNLAAWNPGP